MILSIVILFFLTRTIGRIALKKGVNPTTWKLRAVMGWLIGDMIGEGVIYYFFGLDIIMLGIFGMGMGYAGYLFVKNRLENISEE